MNCQFDLFEEPDEPKHKTFKNIFPYFGGKSKIAPLVWSKFGPDCKNFIEPFLGSAAVLLARPKPGKIETVNDKDHYLTNFWRAIKYDPETTAYYADWPINEADVHARQLWLVNEGAEILKQIYEDPDFYCPKCAGYWVWGISSWIGSGWCVPKESKEDKKEVREQLPKLALTEVNGGIKASTQGVQKLPGKNDPYEASKATKSILCSDMTTSARKDVQERLPCISVGFCDGKYVHQSRSGIDRLDTDEPEETRSSHIQNAPCSDMSTSNTKYTIYDLFHDLSIRLRRVRITCGDWHRVLTKAVRGYDGECAIFLDPPYDSNKRVKKLYSHDAHDIASDVRAWCKEHGSMLNLRIALCGYEGEHNELEELGWEKVEWKGRGGYSTVANTNRSKERIWFSPGCLKSPG